MSENRTEHLRVYFTDSEKQAVQKKAAENGIPASVYVRSKILQEITAKVQS